MISQKNKQGWRNPWVFGLALIMLSAVLINGRMLWNSLHHEVRMLDENYSVRSHKHEAAWVQQEAGRGALGWQAKLHSPQQLQNDSMAIPSAARFIVTASPAQFQFELKDRDGRPLHGGEVVIDAQWPGNSALDFKGTLHEVMPGKYQGDLKFSRAGNWDLMIQAKHNNNLFALEQKVFVAIPQ